MQTDIRIVDYGRGPQLSTSRLTVMDVFYYLQRGRDFDYIHRAMPSLAREEFDVVAAYVRAHHNELVEEDRRVEARIQRDMAEQKARGLRREMDEAIPLEDRTARLREKLRRKLAAEAERNGGHPAR